MHISIYALLQFRQSVVSDWNAKCIELAIPCTSGFLLAPTLGNVMQIRDWTLCGLPPDQYSIENAIIVKNVNRFPLMIDPQGARALILSFFLRFSSPTHRFLPFSLSRLDAVFIYLTEHKLDEEPLNILHFSFYNSLSFQFYFYVGKN